MFLRGPKNAVSKEEVKAAVKGKISKSDVMKLAHKLTKRDMAMSPNHKSGFYAMRLKDNMKTAWEQVRFETYRNLK